MGNELRTIVYTIIILAVLGLIFSNLLKADQIINSISRFGIKELALLDMRPDYNTVVS